MPILLLGAGSILAWEYFTSGDDQSPLPWATILKVAAVAGAVYLVAKAVR